MLILNSYISVDCVVFGFDNSQLKVLLVEREKLPEEDKKIVSGVMKLPGSLINDNEDFDISAYRVLKELTGMDKVFLHQFMVFGNIDRLNNSNDLLWLRKTSNLNIDRVTTIAYYSLVKINESNPLDSLSEKTNWISLDQLPPLTFDHNKIIIKALEALRKELRTEPVGFELLPKKFTLRQLQNLYEKILGNELDNRNFRKRISKLDYLVPLNEKQIGVNHKPAQLYKFDKKLFMKDRKNLGFVI